jgi:hypothetical protein
MKNLCGKERKVDNPYEVWVNARAGWTWRVLKKWQADDDKPYGRWMCAVKSPMTHGGYDMGDVYVTEIKGNATKLPDNTIEDYLKVNPW